MSFNSKYRILIDECMPSEVTLINILGEFCRSLTPNSTFFTSLPLTIGRTYGLLTLTLTIRWGILSFALPLLWWLRCWRYIFVIVSISESCLSVKSPAQGFSLSSLLSSASIFPNRSKRRRIILRVRKTCDRLSCLDTDLLDRI